jgi:phosphoadenosine phosphosulfate reductase
LVNLVADNPQIRWYVTNLEIGRSYQRDTVITMLLESTSSKNVVKFVYNAFRKLIELPLGTSLHFGYVTDDGSLVRTKCSISDPRVCFMVYSSLRKSATITKSSHLLRS